MVWMKNCCEEWLSKGARDKNQLLEVIAEIWACQELVPDDVNKFIGRKKQYEETILQAVLDSDLVATVYKANNKGGMEVVPNTPIAFGNAKLERRLNNVYLEVYIDREEFHSWLTKTGQWPLNEGCLLIKWLESVPQIWRENEVSLIARKAKDKKKENDQEESSYLKRKTSFNQWQEQKKVDANVLKREDIYKQLVLFDKKVWNVKFATFERDFWPKISAENDLAKKRGRPPV